MYWLEIILGRFPFTWPSHDMLWCFGAWSDILFKSNKRGNYGFQKQGLKICLGVWTSVMSCTSHWWAEWALTFYRWYQSVRPVLFVCNVMCLLDSPEQMKHLGCVCTVLLSLILSRSIRGITTVASTIKDVNMTLWLLICWSWNVIQLTVIKHSLLVFHFTSCVLCYQSHTVCLHLLVLYCNNSPSTSVHPQFFCIIVFWWCCCVHLFLHLVFCELICWLAQPHVWLMLHAQLLCFFLCFFLRMLFQNSWNTKKKLSLNMSSEFQFIITKLIRLCLWSLF